MAEHTGDRQQDSTEHPGGDTGDTAKVERPEQPLIALIETWRKHSRDLMTEADGHPPSAFTARLEAAASMQAFCASELEATLLIGRQTPPDQGQETRMEKPETWSIYIQHLPICKVWPEGSKRKSTTMKVVACTCGLDALEAEAEAPASPVLPQQEQAPRCPVHGYVMVQQFDETPINALAARATPNGKYICYACKPVIPPTRGGA